MRLQAQADKATRAKRAAQARGTEEVARVAARVGAPAAARAAEETETREAAEEPTDEPAEAKAQQAVLKDINIKWVRPPPFGARRDLQAYAAIRATQEGESDQKSVSAGRAAHVREADFNSLESPFELTVAHMPSRGRGAFTSSVADRCKSDSVKSSYELSFELGGSKTARQQWVPDEVKHYYWPPQLEGRPFVPRQLQRCRVAATVSAEPPPPMPAMGNERYDVSRRQLKKPSVVVNVYNRAELVRRRDEYFP